MTLSPRLQFARVGFFAASDHAEERGLAGAVWPDDADDRVGREVEIHVLEEDFVAIGFGDLDGLDDFRAEARAGGNIDLDVLRRFCTSSLSIAS